MSLKHWLLLTSVVIVGCFLMTPTDQAIGAPIRQGTIPQTETATPTATPTSPTPDPSLLTPTPIPALPTPTPIPTGGPDRSCDTNPWQFTANMTTLRGGHTAVAAEGYLFVIGGAVGNGYGAPYTGVERAAFNADGTLQPWQRVSDLSSKRPFAAAVVNENYIYVLGGQDNTVERSQVNSDGSLNPWQAVTPMNERRTRLAAVVAHQHLYALGGLHVHVLPPGGVPPLPMRLASVERAEIRNDGTLGTWESVEPLSIGREAHTAVVAGDSIYVMGGYLLGGDAKTVERAVINGDGTLGPWQSINSISVERIEPISIVHNNYIYLLGGYTSSGTYHKSIERAKINTDGSLDKWELVYPMNRQRAAGAAAVQGDRLYVAGGSYANDNSDTAASVEWVDLNNLSIVPDYSLSINNGAIYTNQPAVTLNISAQPGTTEMQISNDGGFTGATWQRCVTTKAWEITRFGNYVIPRLVYIRYKDQAGNTSTVFQDDIILDVTAPSGSIEIVPIAGTQRTAHQPAAAATTAQPRNNLNALYLPLVSGSSTNCPTGGTPNVTLQLTAQDDVSGVADMMISNAANFACATWQPFKNPQKWYVPTGATTTVYAQFRDNAGNVSAVVQDTITLPAQ